jgi:hypothetical protein
MGQEPGAGARDGDDGGAGGADGGAGGGHAIITENGGKSRPGREPSVKPKPIWSPIFFGMVLGKRGVKIDMHCGLAAISNSSHVGGRFFAEPCIQLQDHPFPARNCPQSRHFSVKTERLAETETILYRLGSEFNLTLSNSCGNPIIRSGKIT